MKDSNFTLLSIGQMAGSHRGIRQEISPIANGRIRRKLSGRAYSTARGQFNVFRTTVYFEDVWPPALGGLWVGQRVTIDCAVMLPQPQLVGSAPIRPVVPGTLKFYDTDMDEVLEGDPSAAWFNYCPRLEVLVEPWNLQEDEWGAVSSGDITFIEVEVPGVV
ncbi:hypothetical protein [Devosia faecipullorum]|uniref:hypothetical protein n=1 Tax=Devosia faecipullorum TaxID=2755039 RepID=UPI00187BBA22|nr:hypothetical protein [Devosia faecipullorum]MBE7732179.1 hypothetical protein [Devosia faecipullorum]